MNLTGSSSTASGIAMGFTLLLLMFAAAFWLIRKTQQPRSNSLGALEVLAAQSIGPAQQLQLVRVGDRTLLLGVCPQSITLLLNVEGPLPGLGDRAAIPGRAANSGFVSLFQSMVRR